MSRQNTYRRRTLLKAKLLDKAEYNRQLGLTLQSGHLDYDELQPGCVEWVLLEHFLSYPLATILPRVRKTDSGEWLIEPRDERDMTTRGPVNTRVHVALAMVAIREFDPAARFDPKCFEYAPGLRYHGVTALVAEIASDLAQIKNLGMWVPE